jgi:hypothetical protein
VGLDGYALLEAIDAEDASAWLREVPAVKTPRRIWGSNITGAMRDAMAKGPFCGRWL